MKDLLDIQAVRNLTPDEIVEIKLWEIYLLYHPGQLYKTLTEASIDNGPLADDLKAGQIIFRFKADEWHGHIQQLFSDHQIPLIEQHDAPSDSVKSRRAVFR